jgi:hypothetical protein
MSTENKKPVAEAREGTVRIAIWENDGQKGKYWKAGEPELSYKDAEGKWHNDGRSYSEFDLVNLMIAAAKAKSKIAELRKAAGKAAAGEDDEV